MSEERDVPTTDIPTPDVCPRCGCQTRDPFGFGIVIHNIEQCALLAARKGE